MNGGTDTTSQGVLQSQFPVHTFTDETVTYYVLTFFNYPSIISVCVNKVKSVCFALKYLFPLIYDYVNRSTYLKSCVGVTEVDYYINIGMSCIMRSVLRMQL